MTSPKSSTRRDKEAEYKLINVWEIEEPEIAFHPYISEDELYSIAESIKKQGQLQNITVRRKGDHYQLIIGHVRLQAAKKYGIPALWARIVDVDDKQAIMMMMEENLARYEHNPGAEIQAILHMKEKLGLSVKEMAERTGYSESWIRQRLEVAKLPDMVLEYVWKGQLPISVAHTLLRLPTAQLQIRFGIDFVHTKPTVAAAEAIINSYLQQAERLQRPLTEEEIRQVQETPTKPCDLCQAMKPIIEFTVTSLCKECYNHLIYLLEKEKQELKILERRQEWPPQVQGRAEA